LEIDCIEWALKKIEVNKLPIDRLEAVTHSSHDQGLRKKKRQLQILCIDWTPEKIEGKLDP
jgi:hypothetical protein